MRQLNPKQKELLCEWKITASLQEISKPLYERFTQGSTFLESSSWAMNQQNLGVVDLDNRLIEIQAFLVVNETENEFLGLQVTLIKLIDVGASEYAFPVSCS
ncbi:hypothetical protein O181_019852 [Austropuccinia psidii MF-1]|uniref:Uncharacterized protein n=1 Tax=Austropuccinia psidii MF-1 TaxID=1389203 RepID=A0A9Q3CCE0_9BASI|nr:hypothetical protein [Austropuccinia psidii MF-1]